jgi:hypothetical protein
MAPARWSSDKWNVTRVGEDTIPTVGCSVAVLLSAGLITARTRDGNLSPPLEQALHLLLGAYAEDVLQLTVHLADTIGGGHAQSIQERCGHNHVLAGPGKGWMQRTLVVHGGVDGSGLCLGFGEVDGGGLLHPQCGLVSL